MENDAAMIVPGTYEDPDSGEKITVSVSPHYSTITIGKRDWYFIRETGKFDGTSVTRIEHGPILAFDSSTHEKPVSGHATADRNKNK